MKPLTARAYLSVVPLRAGRRGNERKGTLPTPALSRAGARRAAEPISKVRPDAEEILRLVLVRLDDMKAEDTVTIDLTGKSTIADCMVVTSCRSSRHVGAVADSVLEDLALAGVPNARPSRWPTGARQPGFTSMASNRRCPRPHCAPPVIKSMPKHHTMRIGERPLVETVNRPCLS